MLTKVKVEVTQSVCSPEAQEEYYNTNRGRKPARSEVGLDINVNSNCRFTWHFTCDSVPEVLPSEVHQFGEILHLI